MSGDRSHKVHARKRARERYGIEIGDATRAEIIEAIHQGRATVVTRHSKNNKTTYDDGVNGMTLVDVIEMLADWKAATERHDDGSLARSIPMQAERFGLSPQVVALLQNTAVEFGWLDTTG